LAAVASEAERAVVVFESPHRLQRSLDDLVVACGPERPVAVCRELTKLHEEVWRCSLGEAAERSQAVKPRGEYVIVLGPPAGQLRGGPPGEELGAVSTEPM
jgi:16S rRNA (cytidine1402-2'-O)-methyltransferase